MNLERVTRACGLLLLFATSVPAQSPLCTIHPFRANGGGSIGGVVFFDLTVRSAVDVDALDVNFGATPGTSVGLELWTTPGTFRGAEQNRAAWTRIGVDDGTALAAGPDAETRITLRRPARLPVGGHGIALVAVNSGHRYTNGNGSNETFSTDEMTFVAGAAQNLPFAGTPFYVRVWNGCIHYLPVPVDPGLADLVELQFDEPRGPRVANAATTGAAPSHAIVRGPSSPPSQTWQADPGRAGFGANEPGFGCLGVDDVPPFDARVETRLPLRFTGSHTISFHLRPSRPVLRDSSVFGALFGLSQCIHRRSRLSLVGWGNLPAAVDTATDPGTGGWSHWTAVVDDVAGRARWYRDGMPDGPVVAFAPGTFAVADGDLVVGGAGLSADLITRFFDVDDFRVYGRALSWAEVRGAGRSENAAATTFGGGCPGPTGVPTIGWHGGPPRVGNAAFAVDVGNLETGVPAALWIGTLVRDGGRRPVDLAWLLGPGCVAETLPDLVAPLLPGSVDATIQLPIPPDPGLAGHHAYCQVLVLGSAGAASPALDVHVQL